MTAEALLSRLDHVKRTGNGRYVANCPSHASKSKSSLAVRELDDGRVLAHCFGGCDIGQVLKAINLPIDELFPEKALAGHGNKPERRPFPAIDALRCLVREATYVALVASDLARGNALTEVDRKRLLVAAGRINTALEVSVCR